MAVLHRISVISLLALGVVGGAIGIAALDGCSSTTDAGSSSYSPITSIIVRAEAARGGKGCGIGGTDVFKYAAVLRTETGTFVSGNLYDCFTDAAFRDPFDLSKPAPTFKVEIYAFDKATVDAKGDADLAAAARTGNTTLLGVPTVACNATPERDVEVVAVCTVSDSDAGVTGDAAADTGADASPAKDAGDAATDSGDAAADAP